MKKGNYTPAPWVENADFVFAGDVIEGNIICEAPINWNRSIDRWPENSKLIAASPDLNDCLIDTTAMIMRLHCMMSTVFTDPQDVKSKLAQMTENIERCIVKNREVIIKANGAGQFAQDSICGSLKETFTNNNK